MKAFAKVPGTARYYVGGITGKADYFVMRREAGTGPTEVSVVAGPVSLWAATNTAAVYQRKENKQVLKARGARLTRK